MPDEYITMPYLLNTSNKDEITGAWRSFINKLDAKMVDLGKEAGDYHEILRPNYALLNLLKNISTKMQTLT